MRTLQAIYASIRSKRLVNLLIAALFSWLSLFPLVYILSAALRRDNAFQSRSVTLWGEDTSLENFKTLILGTDFLPWLKNSLLISFAVTLAGLVFASASGYALSRYKFFGRSLMLRSLLITQMFPATMLMLPYFIVLSKLKLLNSFWGLFLIYSGTALPFCIWQMKSYFDALPKDLEESALIDGCSRLLAFWKIVVPLSTPALAITGLFTFLTAWSEYMVAAIVLQNPELYTLPLGLKSFQSSLATQWGLYAAGALVVSLPVVVVFTLISRYLISGLTLGGVKG